MDRSLRGLSCLTARLREVREKRARARSARSERDVMKVKDGQDASGYSARRGSNQVAVRHYNERLILQLIRRRGRLTKAEATRATGLSANAVSTIFRSLEAENLLVRGEPDKGKLGQPSIPASINPDARFYLGLKVGRRSSDLIVLDFAGKVRACRSTFHPFPTPQDSVAFVEASLSPLLKEAKVPRKALHGFGVAIPTELWSWAREMAAPQNEMDAWRDFDIAASLSRLGPWQVYVENDGTAACRAELTFGAHHAVHDIVYFFVGTLIGGGVVLDSEVFTGRTGNAGGFGPLRVPDGTPGKDRLMDHASIYVLEEMIEAAGGNRYAVWTDPAAWADYPEQVDAWIAETARGLAHGAVSSLAVIDFEAVVIDGAFPEWIRDRLIADVDALLGDMDLQGIKRPALAAGKWGNIARAVGAAVLPMAAEYSIGGSRLGT